MIQQLKITSNTMSRDVNFWVESIMEGYITKFVVDIIVSYSEVKRNFSRDLEEETCHL